MSARTSKSSLALARRDTDVFFPCSKFRFRVNAMAVTPPVVLTIAGFDPSSGAGITADIKTIAAQKRPAPSAPTAASVKPKRAARSKAK